MRPGTDAALALSLTHVMLENGWYDADFVRDWTNAADLVDGTAVWELLASRCAQFAPEVAEGITGVPADDIVAAARTMWESRPLAFYTWSGVEQHSGATQAVRAIDVLYALTGSLDVPGGNVLFEAVPSNPVDGKELLSRVGAPAVGADRRPLGPARFGFVTGEDLYTAALERRVTTLVSFGGNLVMAHADSARGREALSTLDFFVHADLFMTPTGELADVVRGRQPLRVRGMKIGFGYSQDAQSLVQLRRPLVAPRGEARSDLRIVFDLATRLGLGSDFWDGASMPPSGTSWRRAASPWRSCAPTRRACGCRWRPGTGSTPTPGSRPRRVAWSCCRPPWRPTGTTRSRHSRNLRPARAPGDLADRFPLVLSCAKSLFFCETQHRQVAALRKSAPDPQLEMHPTTAAARDVGAGDWVALDTPAGSIRAGPGCSLRACQHDPVPGADVGRRRVGASRAAGRERSCAGRRPGGAGSRRRTGTSRS